MGKKNSTCNTTSLTSRWAKLLLTTVLCLGALHMQAQISITTLGSPVTQDFNTLASSGTTNTAVPSGWAFVESGTGANTTYAAGTGSDNAGNTYSFGAAANSERAFGGLQSGSVIPTIGAAFTNNTGSTITSLVIAYTGEQWRLGATGREDRLDFQYSTDATSLTTGTWTDVNALDFTAPTTSGTVGALDGNAAANRTAISFTIASLSIANGTTFRIRWNDFNATSSDDGLAVDDFSLTATNAPPAAGAALDFDGMNDIVSASLPPVFNNLATNDFTMETWFKAGSPGTEPRRIVLAQQDNNNFTSILLSTNNRVYFYVVLSGITYSTSGASLPFNQWAHIAVRWTAATQTVEIFYNGVLQNYFNGGSSSFGTDNTFTLGNGTVLPHNFIGQLDEFRVWDKALSVAEINSRKDCEITGSLPNLVMNYHFNQGNSGANNAAVTTLIDDSGNGYNGTLQNFALTGATSNWVAPGAVATGTTCTCTMLTWYRDMDMDGFGNPAVTQMACLQPTGYVADNTDCDDNDPLEKPDQVWYADVDNDGYSNGTTLMQCLRPAGYKVALELTATTGDCNDNNAAINPVAAEICDGVDNNCNMMTDEGVQTTYYRDMDGDGFGDPSVTQMACSQPMGYVVNNMDCDDNDALEFPGQVWYLDADNDGYSCNMLMVNDSCDSTQCTRPGGVWKAASELISITGDCNDSNANINPDATEIANGIDDNCDGQTDEGAVTYYRDMDNDGYGDPMNTTTGGASPPPGYVLDNTDCDDNDALEKPGQIWYADVDNDGYSSGTTLTQCLRPAGYKVASELTATSGDCNDNNAAINPAATEVCDGVDNNCNSMTDEGVQTTYYRDMDGDGFGNPSVTQMACSQPTGYVTNNTDCDDNDALEKPGQVWYADLDNDGYSSGTTLTQCLRPVGYKVAAELTATTGDCNDGNAAINPAATEVCDGVDNNCNMMTDEGVQTTYYRDMDGDGFGNPSVTQMACSQPTGYVTNNTDCDDNDPLEKPGQVWYADVDNDGYSSGTTLTQCLRPVGYKVASELTATTGDCNDNNAAINPAATEVCDGVDNNCNMMTDEGVQTTYYRDMDGDGFGNPSVTQLACSQPVGYVTDNTDCNDNNALEKPGQVWYSDQDNDGYGGGAFLTQCARPSGYKAASELIATSGDCNDANEAIYPGATEVCNGIDDDCDMMTDEGVQTTYYRDMDGDGFGNPSVTQMACTAPMGYVANNTDCDDNDALEKPGQVWYADVDSDGYSSGTTLTQCLRPVGYKVASELTATSGDCNDNNASVNPAAQEICDGVDNNCNGQADEPQAIGGAWSSNDVGTGVNGSANVGCSNGSSVYNVSATGFSTSASDKLHLVSQQLCGNGEIIARVLATNNAGWAGITLRESLMPGAKKVALKTQLSSIIRREIRTMTNAPVNMLNFNRPTHIWLRLTRSGSNFVGYTSMDGLIWDFAFSANVTMTGCIYAGIFAESINTNVETTASFDNVSITGGTPGFSANAPSFTPSLNGLEVSVYPNPSNGEVTLAVQSETDRSLNLTVVDALGRIVRNIELNEGAVFNYPLDLGKEPAGIYYLRLRSESGEANVQRIVITR